MNLIRELRISEQMFVPAVKWTNAITHTVRKDIHNS